MLTYTKRSFFPSPVTFLLLFPLLLYPIHSQCQPSKQRYVLSGFVMDSLSHESLPAASIAIMGTTQGTITNNYGFYSIPLDSGDYTVEYSYVGYSPCQVALTLRSDTTIDAMLGSNITIQDVMISGIANHEASRSPRMGSHLLPKRAIEKVPMIFGEHDVLRIVQLMPGVQKGNEGSNDIYVRGGSPDQNLILLDGAPVYNATHLMGMFSLFNGNAIKSTELIKGGFPARYGGRLSSVIEMVMDEGDMRRYHGDFSIGLISASAMVQGPIVKDKVSFIVTGRRTYVDALLRPWAKVEEGVPTVFFYDFTGKVNWKINGANRLYLSGYLGQDKFGMYMKDLGAMEKMNFGWGNATGALRWNCVINPSLFSNLSAVYSYYGLNILNEGKFENIKYRMRYASRIQNVSLKWDLNYTPHQNHQLRAGIASTGYLFEPRALEEKHTELNIDTVSRIGVYTLEAALYIEDEMRLADWGRANVGLRASYYAAPGYHRVSPEPRASLAVYLHPQVSLKAAFSMMGQQLHLLSSSGFGLPTDLWIPATRNIPLQTGWQTSLGLTYDINKIGSTLSLEGYYKQAHGATHYKEGSSFVGGLDFFSTDKYYWEDKIAQGNSWSAGLELLFQRKAGALTGWMSYTLAFTRMKFPEINFGNSFWAPHDRRHALSMVALYEINDSWSISATFVFCTGTTFVIPESNHPIVTQPKTPPLAAYGNAITQGSYENVVKYGAIDQLRMENYHRLDIGAQWRKQAKYVEHRLSFDIYNVYCRRNPFFYYPVTEVNSEGKTTSRLYKFSLFPIIPTISYGLKF